MVSTAGDAVLSVVDPSTTAPGHLVNGTFVLPSALQARARNAANTGTAFNAVSGTPLNLLAWSAPISNDAITLEFAQPVAANDALRTGTYSQDPDLHVVDHDAVTTLARAAAAAGGGGASGAAGG